MAQITQVRIDSFKDGRKTVIINYKSKYGGRDRTRFFRDLPKSAEEFIRTASHVETLEWFHITTTTYKN